VVVALTPTLLETTFTQPLAVNTFTHLQHTRTLLLAVNMRTQLLVLFLVSNMRTQLLVLSLVRNTTIQFLHLHRFQGLLLTLLLSIWTLLLRQKTK
jgi:hypothetical protein